MLYETKELTDLPLVLTPQQQLAAAMRRGCALKPLQIVGVLFDGANGACALGAAILGLGENPGTDSYEQHLSYNRVVDNYPLLRKLSSEICDRNNRGESRESIADWIETLP
jgi:hypothetical protein